MIVPFTQVIKAKIQDSNNFTKLKYLQFNLHDTNISNFLRFLGYWQLNGYHKHVRFASSVRLELLVEKDKCFIGKPRHMLRIVYDDEEIRLPFC